MVVISVKHDTAVKNLTQIFDMESSTAQTSQDDAFKNAFRVGFQNYSINWYSQFVDSIPNYYVTLNALTQGSSGIPDSGIYHGLYQLCVFRGRIAG